MAISGSQKRGLVSRLLRKRVVSLADFAIKSQHLNGCRDISDFTQITVRYDDYLQCRQLGVHFQAT